MAHIGLTRFPSAPASSRELPVLQAKEENLKFLIMDQGDLGGTVLTYPRRKLVMTQPMELPLYGSVRERMERAIKQGAVNALFNSHVTRIEKDQVLLEQHGHELMLPNDQIFVFIGGELPTEFLKKIGVEFSRKFGER